MAFPCAKNKALNQCFLKTDPRTIFGPPKSFNSPWKIFGFKKHKIFTKISFFVEQTDPKRVDCVIFWSAENKVWNHCPKYLNIIGES